jgi:hypothetical protein
MATITANGGAAKYWRRDDESGIRVCLCKNSRLLIYRGRWRLARLSLEEIEGDSRWIEDKRPQILALLNRTNWTKTRS